MKIVHISPASFASNTYLLISGHSAYAVDPSVSVGAIEAALSAENASLEGILLTHGHFDHILSIDTLRDKTGVPVLIHNLDAEMLTDGRKNAFYVFYGRDRVFRPADKTFDAGDKIRLGDETITVIHTPGHSKGSVCFDCGSFLVTGDTLFSNTIGRCDLHGGNELAMVRSLERLRALDPALTIYPGHGDSSSLGAALDSAAYYL